MSLLSPGQSFGPYQLVELIGGSSSGGVWKATKEGGGSWSKAVALKVLHAASADADAIATFEQEAQIAALLDHPNIVGVHAFGREESFLWFEEELVDGENLARLLERAPGGLPVPLALYVVSQVLSGLEYAFERHGPQGRPLEIIHRDIQPSNVLIGKQGHVKIADFGIAKITSKTNATRGSMRGSVAYLAAEVARGEPSTARSDVFTVGLGLWELLTGQPLFVASTVVKQLQMNAACEVPRLSERGPSVDEAVEDYVRRMLASDPDERFATAGEALEALSSLPEAREAGPVELKRFMAQLPPPRPSKAVWVEPPPAGARPPGGGQERTLMLDKSILEGIKAPSPPGNVTPTPAERVALPPPVVAPGNPQKSEPRTILFGVTAPAPRPPAPASESTPGPATPPMQKPPPTVAASQSRSAATPTTPPAVAPPPVVSRATPTPPAEDRNVPPMVSPTPSGRVMGGTQAPRWSGEEVDPPPPPASRRARRRGRRRPVIGDDRAAAPRQRQDDIPTDRNRLTRASAGLSVARVKEWLVANPWPAAAVGGLVLVLLVTGLFLGGDDDAPTEPAQGRRRGAARRGAACRTRDARPSGRTACRGSGGDAGTRAARACTERRRLTRRRRVGARHHRRAAGERPPVRQRAARPGSLAVSPGRCRLTVAHRGARRGRRVRASREVGGHRAAHDPGPHRPASGVSRPWFPSASCAATPPARSGAPWSASSICAWSSRVRRAPAALPPGGHQQQHQRPPPASPPGAPSARRPRPRQLPRPHGAAKSSWAWRSSDSWRWRRSAPSSRCAHRNPSPSLHLPPDSSPSALDAAPPSPPPPREIPDFLLEFEPPPPDGLAAILDRNWVHPLAGPERHMPIRASRRYGAYRSRSEGWSRYCGSGHCGVDLGTEVGTPVVAARTGTVDKVVRRSLFLEGKYVKLEHDGGLRSYYMHLDEVAADLKAGDTVQAGEYLGTLGATGVRSSGPPPALSAVVHLGNDGALRRPRTAPRKSPPRHARLNPAITPCR